MSEPQRHPESQPVLDRSFVNKIDVVRQLAQMQLEEGQKRFFGPHYQVFKDGRVVDCYTMTLGRLAKAQQQIEIVVAVKHLPVAHSHLQIQERAGRLIAENDIMTGIRGAGFALPPLLVGFDLVQREANLCQQTIIMQEQDQHLAEMRYYQTMLNTAHTPEIIQQLTAELERLRSERARWLTLFGAGGQLGYNSNLCKIFTPQQPRLSMEQLEAIILEARLDKQGVPLIVDETPLLAPDVLDVQQDRQIAFVRLLGQAR